LAEKPYPEIKCTGLTVLVEGEPYDPDYAAIRRKPLPTTVETTESALVAQSVKTGVEPLASCETAPNLTANFGSSFEEAALVVKDLVKFATEVTPVN
jgi:hypothetical protein